MVAIVLTIGTANILLGYALAFYLRRVMDALPEPTSPPSEVVQEETTPEPVPEAEEPDEDEDLLASSEAVEEIPASWVDRLEAESIHAKSFVEATAHVMRLEVGKYRDALIRLENDLRADGVNASRMRRVIDRLVKLNRQWLGIQKEAADHLYARAESLAHFADIGEHLAATLSAQQSQILANCGELAKLDAEEDEKKLYPALAHVFADLVLLAHQLRDSVGDTLLATLRAEGRIQELEKPLRTDGVTGFQNKAGFEAAIEAWWKSDPNHSRLVSAALLDITDVGQCNQQFGTQFGDELIAAAGSLLDDVLRKDRGFETVARIHGQQFLLFFGDTGPRNATSAVERLRQSFVDATFEHGDGELAVNVSCAATEVLPDDDLPTLLRRLQATVEQAKKHGRNCTMLDEGEGPQPVTPPDYQLPRRVISICS